MIELALARHETISVPHPIQMRLHPLGVSKSAGLQSSSDHADLYGDGTCGSKSYVLCAAPHVHNDRRTKIGAQKSAAYRGGPPAISDWRPAQFEEGRLRGGSSGISAQQRRRSGEL